MFLRRADDGRRLQTVNVRLNPEQILYTLNHAGPKVLLVNSEFLTIVEGLKDRIETVEKYVLISDTPHAGQAAIPLECEYEALLLSGSSNFDFPDFNENTRATTFYTTGTTGLPKGVYFSHRQLVLHTLAETAALALSPKQGRAASRRRLYADHARCFMSTPGAFPTPRPWRGSNKSIPAAIPPKACWNSRRARASPSRIACRPSAHDSHASEDRCLRSAWLEDHHRRLCPADRSCRSRRSIAASTFSPATACQKLARSSTLAHVKSDLRKGEDDKAINLRVKAGLPVPLVDLRIVDSDMKDVAHDGKASGEIVVRAPWLTQGYLNNPRPRRHSGPAAICTPTISATLT